VPNLILDAVWHAQRFVFDLAKGDLVHYYKQCKDENRRSYTNLQAASLVFQYLFMA
jgi:hypothetical protein